MEWREVVAWLSGSLQRVSGEGMETGSVTSVCGIQLLPRLIVISWRRLLIGVLM